MNDVKPNDVNKEIILIGDSYGTLYRNNTTTIPTQIKPLLNKHNISFYHRFVSGSGFSNGGFLQNLHYLDTTITNKEKIDEIWVFGGWNDEIGRNKQTIEELQTAMSKFSTYAKEKYTNAKIKLSFISFGFKVNTSSTENQLNGLKKVYNTYSSYASQVGIEYVKGLESVCHYSAYMEPNDGITDGGHPNDLGIIELAKRITDIITTGSTTIRYVGDGIQIGVNNGYNTLANGVSKSGADWYFLESIIDTTYRLFTYIISDSGTTPVFSFSGPQYENIKLSYTVIPFFKWKAQCAVPSSENFVINVPVTLNIVKEGETETTSIHTTVEFLYLAKSTDTGEDGYEVSFRIPYMYGVKNGTLKSIVINSSAEFITDIRYNFI